MKLALVHDYLVQDGGSEQVLRVLSSLYPDTPIFTLFHDKNKFNDLHNVRTSFLQSIPGAMKRYEWFLPLMPAAIEHLPLKPFDMVVSSSSTFAKGVLVPPHAFHICYCHTPTRFLWLDAHEYLDEMRHSWPVRKLLPIYLSRLRQWDRLAADRVDLFVANSEAVRERIRRYYRKDAIVVHPPVDTDRFSISHAPKTYYLAGGRFVGYKRIDIAIDAANRLKLPLKVFGDGPLRDRLKDIAGDTVEFVGRVENNEQARLFADCIAYIAPQEEDFGITAVESMASGRPVISFSHGGAKETVKSGITGVLFNEQNWESLADAIINFDESRFDPAVIRAHTEQFSRVRFENEMLRIIEHTYSKRFS
ncbi:MAG: glycosyltransferase [Patescibacteria group bacterium]